MVKNGLIYSLTISNASELERILICGILDDTGVEAIEEEGELIRIYHEEQSFIDERRDLLLSSFDWLSEDHAIVASIPNENWNKKWESSFEPIIVDDFCTIRASFHKIKIDTPYEITINPELAFGTGHHETTYQMMAAMKKLSFADKKVLDYGCGTGILAILAHLLGAGDIDAIDYDAQAIDCAQDCLSLNTVDDIQLYTGELELLSHKDYDIILANINRKVLLESAKTLYKMQSHSGVLLLSGILKSDENIVLTAYKSTGYTLTDQLQRGEWLCLKLMKM
ncbi:MAG: ribosomal protein L11 methyltransferase [Saprospiraceae bacterium]|jgi:ribosomal protein L11 methyltransferase